MEQFLAWTNNNALLAALLAFGQILAHHGCIASEHRVPAVFRPQGSCRCHAAQRPKRGWTFRPASVFR